MYKNTIKQNKGFTLAELLITVTIMALLSSTVLSSSVHILQSTRDAKRLADMEAIENALSQFFLDEGFYPGENQTLKDGTSINVSNSGEYIGDGDDIDTALAPYMNVIPRDPLHDGTKYFYSYDPQHLESNDIGCMDDKDPTHPLHYSRIDGITECDCGYGSGVSSAAFGFNRRESQGTQVEVGTCVGNNKHLDTAHFNRLMFPMPN